MTFEEWWEEGAGEDARGNAFLKEVARKIYSHGVDHGLGQRTVKEEDVICSSQKASRACPYGDCLHRTKHERSDDCKTDLCLVTDAERQCI